VPRRFLPSLATKPSPAQRDTELKVVLASYYNALTSAGLYANNRVRPWPVERAVAEAYERLVWVFKSVEAIAGNASRLPVRLKRGEDIIEDHPLYRVLNKKANPLETGRQFRKRLSAQILLSKRGAFVEVTRSRGGDIVRLDLLPPGRTRPVPGDPAKGEDLVAHYEVLRADGSKKELPAESVRWFREPHPLDPFTGVTPLEAAGLSVELDFFSRLYNVSFMRNDARPGGILGVDGEMEESEMDRVEDRFGKGPLEAGKLTVINGKISYVDVAARPRDAQYENTSRSAKLEILSAFGVAESVLGYAADRTYDNADAELYNFWTITMPPHMDLIATGLDEDSEDDLVTFLDTSEVEVLQRAKIAKRAEMREEFDKGLVSPDEYREEAGYDKIDTHQTRALYMPTGKTPVPTSEADAEEFGLGGPEPSAAAPPGQPPPQRETEGEEEPEKPPQGGQNQKPPPAREPGPVRQPPPARKTLRLVGGTRRAVRVIKAKAVAEKAELVSDPDTAARDKLEATLAAALAAMAVRLAERAVARLGSPKSRKGTRHWTAQFDIDTRVGTKALDAARVVAEETWRAQAEQTVRAIILDAAYRAADTLLADLDAADLSAKGDLDTVTGEIIALVGESAARQALHLTTLINQADQRGRSIDEIVALVRQHEEHLTSWADRVAAQAATATVAGARDTAAKIVADGVGGVVDRMWLTRKDDKVRDTHADVHGQHQPLGEPFHVGDALLRYPGDPFGPPGQVINCRCLLQHRARRSGRYVATPAGERTRELAATGTEGKAIKHLPGEHNQASHGWAGGGPARRPATPDEPSADTAGGGEVLRGDAAYAAVPNAADHADPDELRALSAYTLSGYRPINVFHRTGEAEPEMVERIKERTELLDRLFGKAPELAEPIEVVRGVKDARALFGEIGERRGRFFTDLGYVSTSTDQEKACRFAGFTGGGVVRIRFPAGARVVRPPEDDEHEVLAGRGAVFRLLEDELDDATGARTLLMELVA
jgi:HK97 family phage portal protein